MTGRSLLKFGIVFILVVTLVGILIATTNPNSSDFASNIKGVAPSDTIDPSLTITITSTDEATPFAVENNKIFYGHSDTFDCQYIIAGVILDVQGNPISEDVVVTLDMLETEGTDSGLSQGWTATERGDSGWSAALPNWSVDYQIWLTQISTGERISPKIFVHTRDCKNNLAIVNFKQFNMLN